MSALLCGFLLATASFALGQTVPTPQFSPPSGAWVPTNVTITCADAAAALHYTLDGTTPDTNAPLYTTGPLWVTNATTVRARAFRTGQTPSAVATADYYEADLARIRKSVTNNATASPSVVLTVTPFEGVACYGVEETIPAGLEVTEVNIGGVWNVTNRTLRWGPYPDASPRLFTYTVREVFRLGVTNEILSRISLNGWSFPPDDYNVTVTVQLAPPPPPVATPVFDPPGGVSLPATIGITSATTNARIYYTLDGSRPTTNSLLYTGQITLTNGATLRAIAFVDGQEPTDAAFATFDPAWEQAAPMRSITNNATSGPEVRLAVTPAAGVECHGVHEMLPPLLVPESISHGGVWTAEDRTIRWGPFRDDLPRELSYVVRGPAGDYALEGMASFDGRNLAISGASTATVDNYEPPVETPVFIPSDGSAAPATVSILPPPRTFSLRPSASSDDAEEVVTNGVVSLFSDDLELGADTGVEQMVGLRFASVQVPRDAVILDARVQFTQEEDENAEPFGVVIRAEASSMAAPFTTNLFDVSSRTGTVASVLWTNVPAWTSYHESGTNQQTPSLAALVREVMARTNWVAGNSLVFLLTGQGCRTAMSYDGQAALAPRLDITYAVTNGVRIYYTTDGSLPSTNSTLYTGPIAVTGMETLRARAFQDGFAPSEPSWAEYHDLFVEATNLWRSVTNDGTVEPEVVVHVVPPATVESYGVEETLPLALVPSGITDQGVWDETNRTIKWGPFQDNQPRDLSYRVQGWGGTNELTGVGSFDGRSAEVAGAQTVSTADSTEAVATPVLSPVETNSLPATVTITCATPGAEVYYTTDSTLPTTSAQRYSGPLTISSFTALRARAFRAGMMPSAEAVGVYQQSLEGLGSAGRSIVNATSPAPVISINAVVSAEVVSWAVEERLPSVLTPSAVSHGGVWLPDEGKIKWGPFEDHVERTLIFTAHGPDGTYPLEGTASFNGWNTPVSGEVTLAIADTQTPVATPQFDPADGATVPVAVSILCATPGAEIRYTTDGSVPTAGATLYNGSVSVLSPLTLRARAFRTSQNPSDTASATYVGADIASRVVRRVLDTPFPVQRVELAAQPAGTVESYAVEEAVPVGLVPSSLSHDGVWNLTNRMIKWGPFRDHTDRTLVYSISGPDGTYSLDGQGSFDGQPVGPVGDASAVIAFPAPTNLVAVPANRAVYLAWPRMTNASGYYIHYWADGASGQPAVQDAGVPSGQYYALQNLTNNTLYFICVAAYDANRNESPRSEVVTAVPSESAGVLGVVAWNHHYYNPASDVAVVTVTDANPNTDPTAVETVTVRITSYSDTLGFDLTLAETATNSGIFTSAANGTNVGFTFGNSDVVNKLIRVVPGDVLTARYADVLPPIPTTATAFVALSGVPRPVLSGPTMAAGGLFQFIVSPDADLPSLRIQSSTNLVNWETLTNLLNPSGPIVIVDPEAVSHAARFYRAVSP